MKTKLYDTFHTMLKQTRAILLVDWQHEGIPLALVKAGYQVFSYSPGQYCETFIDASGGEDKLEFKPLDQAPESVNIVYVFRPDGEHAEIIRSHVLPLGAKVFWLHPPLTSVATTQLAEKEGLIYIEGIDITTVLD